MVCNWLDILLLTGLMVIVDMGAVTMRDRPQTAMIICALAGQSETLNSETSRYYEFEILYQLQTMCALGLPQSQHLTNLDPALARHLFLELHDGCDPSCSGLWSLEVCKAKVPQALQLFHHAREVCGRLSCSTAEDGTGGSWKDSFHRFR